MKESHVLKRRKMLFEVLIDRKDSHLNVPKSSEEPLEGFHLLIFLLWPGFPVAQMVTNLPAMQETQV